jgi:hypothetical protein
MRVGSLSLILYEVGLLPIFYRTSDFRDVGEGEDSLTKGHT